MPWRPRAVSNSSPHPRVLHRPFLCLGLGPRRLTRPAQSPFQVIRCPGHRRRRRRRRTRRTRTRTSEATRWSFRLRQPHPHHSRHSSRRRGAVAYGAEAEAGSSARFLAWLLFMVCSFVVFILHCFYTPHSAVLLDLLSLTVLLFCDTIGTAPPGTPVYSVPHYDLDCVMCL